jgi:hypothetical protein
MNRKSEIAAALKSLGVTGKIRVEYFSILAVVYVNGKRFGIYDFIKKTFVD